MRKNQLRKIFALLLIAIMAMSLLCACAVPPDDDEDEEPVEKPQGRLVISNCEVEVLVRYDVNVSYVKKVDDTDVLFTNQEIIEEDGEITFTYDGNNIAFDGLKVYGLLGNTQTLVTASLANGISTTFTVSVTDDDYVNTVTAAQDEDWFKQITVEKVTNLKEDFPLGVDISMVKQIIDNGGKYYNSNGTCQSVYQILADAGVNYIRLRLWNDPYNTYTVGDTTVKIAYGGGVCDLEYVTEMAHDAKQAGLKFLLNFHYSDFWADPSNQVVPKAWASTTTVAEMVNNISTYTTEVLNTLIAAGAKPDMVQIGNETTGGMLISSPGPVNTEPTGGNPYYISQKGSFSSTVRGTGTNLVEYIKAGVNAVKAVDDEILTMIHLARGMTATESIKAYFHQFDDVDYDVIGLSYYPYYHGRVSDLTTTLNALSTEFADKKITIAETAYGFTYAASTYANNIFVPDKASSSYEVSVQGQADFIRDVIAALNSIPNGYGLFYWEAAWIPVSGAGWADSRTLCTWANQALFSYDGKALPSLYVFQLVK